MQLRWTYCGLKFRCRQTFANNFALLSVILEQYLQEQLEGGCGQICSNSLVIIRSLDRKGPRRRLHV